MERRSVPRGQHSVLRDALYSTLRLIERHVRGFFGALAAFATVSFVIALGAVAVFAYVAHFVSRGVTQTLDDSVLRWIELHRTPFLDKAMLEVTVLGSGVVLLMIVVVASLFLWLTQHKWSVYILLTGVLGGQFLNHVLKGLFDRPRPSSVEWVTQVHSLSFPSGHAMTSMITYGSVAYLVARLEPKRLLRTVTWIMTAAIIVLIGVSRLYLGVHYPSDVIAGYLGGIAWIGFVAASVEAVRFFAGRRPETRKEEHDLNAS
jgi:membrane-associated phospholipid phosphatase